MGPFPNRRHHVRFALFATGAAAFVLTSCAPTVRVSPSVYASLVGSEGASTPAQPLPRRLRLPLRDDAREQLLSFLEAAREASAALNASGVPPSRWADDPKTLPALDRYRHALSLFADAGGIEFARDGGFGRDVTWPSGRSGILHPYHFSEFETAPLRHIRGIDPPRVRGGFGASLTAISNPDPGSNHFRFYPENGAKSHAILVAEFPSAESTRLFLADPRQLDAWKVRGGEVALDLNAGLPVALTLDGRHEWLTGVAGFISVAPRLSLTGIYLIEPYDPSRIPVLFLHGLQSSPLIWRDIAAAIQEDPELRARYQGWFFYYPTGLGIPDSARMLRASLDRLRSEADPDGKAVASRRMVVVGHSMGGILARSLVADVGDRMWEGLSNVPFDEVDIPNHQLERLSSLLFWDPDPAVERVVFIATPHRGSNLATGFIGAIGRMLIHLPRETIDFYSNILSQTSNFLRQGVYLSPSQSSILGLAPSSNLSRALLDSPFQPGVKMHSIIGDRGRGGELTQSSDGVVPYWSSHLGEADSQLVVPTGHGAYAHPDAIAKILHILRENID